MTRHRQQGVAPTLGAYEFLIEDERFKEMFISGDYFCFPKDTVSRLEKVIEGSPTKDILKVVTGFYQTSQFEWPGVEINDWIHLFEGLGSY